MKKSEEKQTTRYTNTELATIKSAFADNADLILALRKTFLQMPLDAVDKASISGYKGKDLLVVIRKTFLPTLDANAPAHQLIDLWMSLQIKDKTPEQAFPHILARQKHVDYLDQQIKVLEGKEQGKIDFKELTSLEGKTPLEIYCDLVTRNTIIADVEMMLSQLTLLAGQKNETPDETIKRLQKDSTK